jgi:hypothetical protein
VARTRFDPQIHGFAFPNRWRLDEKELQVVGQKLSPGLQQAVIVGSAAFGCLGRLPFGRAFLRLRQKVESDLAEGFGLCGGMCFAALDLYRAGVQVEEQGLEEPPPAESPLHTYILKRQIHSLVHARRMASDALRYVVWHLIFNHVPTRLLRGGAGWLLRRSQREWAKLKASIDSEEPAPILLVRHTADLFGNHQVLAIGYEEARPDRGTIHVYDPNCPAAVNTIEIDFEERRLDGRETCGDSPPLRGFFCQAYHAVDPAEILA